VTRTREENAHDLQREHCAECGNFFDDNPGSQYCKTCEDWMVEPKRRLDVCDKPCTRCTGTGMAGKKGMAFCGRCCGSGIEPETVPIFPQCRQPRLT